MSLGVFECNITSPESITNTFEISCELLDTLRRISVAVTYADCNCCQPITVIGDSPVVVSDLVAGQYIVEIGIPDTAEINDTIVETITVSNDDKPSINSTTNDKMITQTDISTSTMFLITTTTAVVKVITETSTIHMAVTPTNGLSSTSEESM